VKLWYWITDRCQYCFKSWNNWSRELFIRWFWRTIATCCIRPSHYSLFWNTGDS